MMSYKMKYLLIIPILIFVFCSFNIETTFSNIKSLPKSWTMLERDSIGYLVYNPCDGSTPQINIEGNSTLTIRGQLEKTEYKIKKISEPVNNNFLISCQNITKNNKSDVVFRIKLVDKSRYLYLWTCTTDFGSQTNLNDTTKWIMTPSNCINKFRKVDNPCKTEKKIEKTFLPVEYK